MQTEEEEEPKISTQSFENIKLKMASSQVYKCVCACIYIYITDEEQGFWNSGRHIWHVEKKKFASDVKSHVKNSNTNLYICIIKFHLKQNNNNNNNRKSIIWRHIFTEIVCYLTKLMIIAIIIMIINWRKGGKRFFFLYGV